MRFMTLAAIVVALQAGAPAKPSAELWFPTGAAELLLSEGSGMSRLMSWQDYAALTANMRNMPRIVVVQARPPLSDRALFGQNFSYGGKNRTFAVDGSDKDGYRIYVDFDADGALSTSEGLPLELKDGHYSTTITKRVSETVNGRDDAYDVTIRVVLDEAIPPDGTAKVPVLRVYGTSVRRGVAELDGVKIPFALLGRAGLYDRPDAEVIFDFDGHGLRFDQSASASRYRANEGKARIGTATYEFHVDRYGRALALTRTTVEAAPRPSLDVGTPVPEFTFRDMDNRDHHASDYRGKVLLLDFWATWCGPCRGEAPRLAALAAEFGPRGLVVIGVNPNDSLADVRGFMTEFKLTWSTVREPLDGPIHRLFRISAWPTHVLIGKDGLILANRAGADDLGAMVAAAVK